MYVGCVMKCVCIHIVDEECVCIHIVDEGCVCWVCDKVCVHTHSTAPLAPFVGVRAR